MAKVLVQTAFQSSRRFSYARQNHLPTVGERVLPAAFGTGLKRDDTTGFAPVKDGDLYTKGDDKGKKLFYGIRPNERESFANASPDTQLTKLEDQPETVGTWQETRYGHPVFLVKTRGLDSFRTWLVIRKKSWGSTEYRRLGYIDWHVNFKSDVTPDAANPSASAVVPGAGSGGRVDGSPVHGVGVYLPVTGYSAANDLQFNKKSYRKS